jgi:ATP/maltotriose-dependent transcriptional regulator MalT
MYKYLGILENNKTILRSLSKQIESIRRLSVPLKIFRVLVLFLFTLSIFNVVFSQSSVSVDTMQNRISKAKAHLAVKNYSVAIYELENISHETNDRTIQRVVNVLLMHSYLEQGDYKRTRQVLQQLYESNRPNSTIDYLTAASQVVSGTKKQLERYKKLGLNISDDKLPAAAAEDINDMRKTLEMIFKHSRNLGKNKELSAALLALLEETTNTRVRLAKDVYDAKRWKNKVSDIREELTRSGSKILSALNENSIKATADVKITDKSKKGKEIKDVKKAKVKQHF